MAMRIDRTRLFDKRVVQRNIRAGRITKEEYAAWMAEVPDATDKIMAREEGGDDDGYEGAKPEEGAAAAPADPAAAPAAPAPAAPAAPAAAVTPEPPPAG